MAPRHIPERDVDHVELIRSFRPSGSATVVSLWDAGAGVRLPMLKWGDCIYSPVYDGMRFSVDVYNGLDRMVAIPTYVEGANLWVGGPADPEACSPSHMWEIDPHQTLRLDALMNPAGQRGRPIVITQTGLGATVGEATFGTDAFRGQLRIYERLPILPEPRYAAPPTTSAEVHVPHYAAPPTTSAEVHVPHIPDDVTRAGSAPAPAAYAPLASKPLAMQPSPARAMRGRFMPAAPPPHAPAQQPAPVAARAVSRGQAGFGAGEEEVRHHRFTGVEYHRPAQPVLFLRVEMREDLEEMVRALLGPSWTWQWPAGWGDDWIAHPWMWPVPPTAPHIPVTRPGPR
jgi:hypothetical protein